MPGPKGEVEYRSLSRQLVMFCVERRKAWRMLQSKAGIENKEYKAQRAILADVDSGKISREDFFARAEELLKARLEIAAEEKPRPAAQPAPAVAAKAAAAGAGAKAPAIVPEPASKSRETEASRPASPASPIVAKVSATVSETVTRDGESVSSEVVVTVASQVAMKKESENDSPDWEQGVQLRLMELDVDPGNDADGTLRKQPGN